MIPLPDGKPPSARIDEGALVRLAAAPGSPSAVLEELARTGSITVRAAVAMNEAAPAEVDAILARDGDERIRSLLGRKLATLVPNLSSAEQSELNREARATLAGLVEDEATRVRAVIANVLKEMPNAPRELILRLAHDTEISVSDPVIRLSPLLTSEDLLALLSASPSAATTLAVARRRCLNEAISDAIAATADTVAIRALLANPSAAIREATLDALIARSVDNVDWHQPMVARPGLPPRAAQALSEIVTDQLLAKLAGRADFSPELAAELRQRLDRRLAESAAGPIVAWTPPPLSVGCRTADLTVEQAFATARAMVAEKKLTEAAMLSTLANGQTRLASAMLAVMAEVPLAVVNRAASLRSAKGLVSLAWKAGFTMRVAVPLQLQLARLAPSAVLPVGLGGNFPLTTEEMRWQLDFLGRIGR